MIRQHHLQQQRLNNNHDQLLQRFQHVGPPQISEFRAFGRSQLPGRKYDQYIDTMNGNHRRRDSLVAQSRASIGGSSSDTYRLMGDGINEILPRNISSIMQHTREQPSPLVLAEKKFEPVAFYEHPVFGRTPAYVRPITDHQRSNDVIDNDSDNEEKEDDDEVPSRTLRVATPKIDGKEETRSTTSTVKDDDNNDDDSARIPKGYISYKNWKEKYANLIPVNPLLYNIYTHRSNGSLHSYGRSLYKSPNHIRALTRDEDDSTPTISDIGSVMSDAPRETSLSSNRQYQRLQPQLFSRTTPSRPRESTPAESDDEESDDESNSSNSPVPYLPQNRTNPILSRPTIGITSSPVSSLPTPSTLNVSNNNTTGISSTPIIPISTSNIPPATNAIIIVIWLN
ncbi:hypothetical protein I4U23_003165 [Adineta vaga]|nr:hypothetical protein I4U23_003165 [Adineta vaga]